MSEVLDLFTPLVRAWFREACGTPMPPQEQGWPAIQRGDHTLILSPTGSGKTLAAFLCEIDRLYRDLLAESNSQSPIPNPKSQLQNPNSKIQLAFVWSMCRR